MIRTCALLVALVAVEPHGVPKPISYSVEGLLDGALLVAEAEIVDVEMAAWMGQNGERGKVRVRVTADPTRVFRGFELLGRELELLPAAPGPLTCSTRLAQARGDDERLLLIVDRRRTIPVIGTPQLCDGRPAYRLAGFCDHNACWFRCGEPTLKVAGAAAPEAERPGFGDHLVPVGGILHRYAAERRPLAAETARFLLRAHEDRLRGPALRRAVLDLGARDAASRDAAIDLLTRRGGPSIDELEAARDATRHPEVRRRLEALCDSLGTFATARAVAESCRRADAHAGVPLFVVEAWPALSGKARLLATARLRAEAELAEPPFAADGDDAAVVAAWRARLGLPESP